MDTKTFQKSISPKEFSSNFLSQGVRVTEEDSKNAEPSNSSPTLFLRRMDRMVKLEKP
jgi:hypothetical protein